MIKCWSFIFPSFLYRYLKTVTNIIKIYIINSTFEKVYEILIIYILLTGLANSSSKKDHVESSIKKIYSQLGIITANTKASSHSLSHSAKNAFHSSSCSKDHLAMCIKTKVQQMISPIKSTEDKTMYLSISVIQCS